MTKVFKDTVGLVLLGLVLLFLWFSINHESKSRNEINRGLEMVICTKIRDELLPITWMINFLIAGTAESNLLSSATEIAATL